MSRVAVVGAGAGGLSAARHLLEDGHDVVVFERGSHVGGLWVYDNDNGLGVAYRSLHINSEPRVTAYRGFPFPPEAGLFPSHSDVASYLDSFADAFDVRRHIRMRTPCTRTHPASNATFMAHVSYRRITVRPGVAAVDGHTVRFDDGTREDVDTIVAATGYEIDLPFLPAHVSPVRERRLDAYQRVVHPDRPGLYFVGFFNVSGGANISMMDTQSAWVAALVSGRSALPSPSRMRADVATERRRNARRFPGTARYGLELEPARYKKRIAREIGRTAVPAVADEERAEVGTT